MCIVIEILNNINIIKILGPFRYISYTKIVEHLGALKYISTKIHMARNKDQGINAKKEP